MPLYSFLGIFLVLLSLFHGCSKEKKEEHAGSDNSQPPESFRIVSVEPEDAAEQVSIQTALSVVFNSEIDQETVYPGSILLLQNSFAWNLKLQRRVASLIQFPRISNGQHCVLVRIRA